jgi:phosphoribosylformimino-5-aminoimidazole carboxamide ribotide isomerase
MKPTGQLEVIPAVDVLDGAVVRLQEGDYDRSTRYAADPVAAVERWLERGARRVHVVDLDGARGGETDLGLWERLGRRGLAFQAGGGIRSAGVAAEVLAAGAERVVMGTAAVRNPAALADVGKSVVAAVDVRDGWATTEGWLRPGRPVAEVLDGLAAAGVGRLLMTGISRDGTMEGPDVDLLATVSDAGRFSLIASGGVGRLGDLDPLARLGCEAVVIGRALYEGRFTLGEAMERAGSLR